MGREQLYRDALDKEAAFEELRKVVINLRSEGIEKETILAEFEALRISIREEDEAKEDFILDVMDQLVGWCHPEHAID